jgi:hypothetical protein
MNTTDPEPDETPFQALARIAEETRQLMDDAAASTEIVPVGRGADVAKRQMAASHSDLLRKQMELKAAGDKVRAQIEAQQRAAEAMMREQLAALEPLQTKIAQLKEGIWTVNLYLGRDETITPIRGGEPAPAETPISIRQKVLSMDEEAALYAAEGGIDHMDIDLFDEWLLADPKNLQQVLPEPRGIVVLVPRRQGAEYNNPWEAEARNKLNRKSYWLIRNGERLYRMHTDVELESGGPTYNVGATLMPTRDEFLDLFWHNKYDHDTGKTTRVLMEPGSREWLAAEKKRGARERHYMRSALILQGLIDRTTVFDPKPAVNVSTLSLESYDAGHVVLITDAEESKQLGTGREPFYKWLERLNSKLRPGMRIVGAFDSTTWSNAGRDAEYGHSRLWPQSAKAPQSLVMHTLQKRKGDGFTFAYDRNEQVYDPSMWRDNPERPGWGWRGGQREAKAKASCTVKPGDRFIIPFDLVTVEEMRTYLEARDERHAYLSMFPLLKATIELKELEAQAEAPMRELLVGELVKAGADREDAEREMPSLVDHWKLANRWHRPLVTGDREVESKAISGILIEWDRRQRAIADQAVDKAMIERFRAAHKPVLIAQKRDGRWVVLEAQRHGYGKSVIPAKTFVTEITYARRARTEPEIREWVLPGVRANKWRIVWQDPSWENWNVNATPSLVLSGPEIEQMARDSVEHALNHLATVGRYSKDYWTTQEPIPSKMLAVTYNYKGEYEGRPPRMVTYVLPDKHDQDDNYAADHAVLDLDTKWTRSTGGKLVLNYDRQFGHANLEYHVGRWHDQPRPTSEGMLERSDLVLYDVEQMNRLDEVYAEIRVRKAARNARSERAGSVEGSVVAEWTRRREAAEYARFMDDYQDASLWPVHREKLTIRYPHSTRSTLYSALLELIDAGVEVDGRTVADLVEQYRGMATAKWEYETPADIADIAVVDRPKETDD